ncbi:MAG: histidinol-phosphatase family [Eubacteriales bacterium]|nr:histidinol-phosphatase family [Eubacteriales bacterium]
MQTVLVDYHVHPNYSIDAQDVAMEVYCQRALELGLKEICFTPHFECNPRRRHLDWFIRLEGQLIPMEQLEAWVPLYLDEVKRLQDEYGDRLWVGAGIEVGYEEGLEGAIEKLLSSYSFDFVIGSIHCLEDVAISSARESAAYFPCRDVEEILELYSRRMERLIASGFFHTVGHFDIYRRHGEKYFGSRLREREEEYLVPLLKEVAKRGLALEINTSGTKTGTDFFPSTRFLELAREAGVEVCSVGSDAHRPEELGREVEKALGLIKRYGFRLLTRAG